jgi:hypothetical protein
MIRLLSSCKNLIAFQSIRYKIREVRRHGEAASADLAAVGAERGRMQGILAAYDKKNRFNFDESGLFIFAIPDRGLSTKGKLSGKKQDKFRITAGLGCNADGSEVADFLHWEV